MAIETYYALAIFVAGFGVLLSAVNTFLLLVDRNRRPRLEVLLQEGSGRSNVFVSPSSAEFGDPAKVYNIVVLIENRSIVPLTVLRIQVITKRWVWISSGRRNVKGNFPARVDGRDHCVFDIESALLFEKKRRQWVELQTTGGVLGKRIPRAIIDGFKRS